MALVIHQYSLSRNVVDDLDPVNEGQDPDPQLDRIQQTANKSMHQHRKLKHHITPCPKKHNTFSSSVTAAI
jgi:hypothetical protein